MAVHTTISMPVPLLAHEESRPLMLAGRSAMESGPDDAAAGSIATTPMLTTAAGRLSGSSTSFLPRSSNCSSTG
jgi:hypothetical protein